MTLRASNLFWIVQSPQFTARAITIAAPTTAIRYNHGRCDHHFRNATTGVGPLATSWEI
jgi:hypothetical protein